MQKKRKEKVKKRQGILREGVVRDEMDQVSAPIHGSYRILKKILYMKDLR